MNSINIKHGGGIRYQSGGVEAYCRVPGCKWVGPSRQSFEDARADGREHRDETS